MSIKIIFRSYSDDTIAIFILDVLNMLKFYYGIFINFLKADLPSVRKTRAKVEKRMNRMIQNLDDISNKNGTYFYELPNYIAEKLCIIFPLHCG